jgi:hypothetical protein
VVCLLAALHAGAAEPPQPLDALQAGDSVAPRSLAEAARVAFAKRAPCDTDRGSLLASVAANPDLRLTAAGGDANDESETGEHRSPGKAFLLSMILPGLGQRHTGHNGRAVGYFIGEGALWTTFTVLKIQENIREEDFEEWAETFAGAKVHGRNRDEEYYQRISRYISSDEYNFEVKALARLIHPGETLEVRAQQLQYIEENSIRGDDTWEWASREKRNEFRVVRHRSLDAGRKANWTLGGMVLLRVLSAIDAAILAGHYNRDHASSRLSPDFILPDGEPGLALVYSRSF